MDCREAFVALNMIEDIGPVRVRQLLEHFGDAPAILRATRSQLLQVRGIGHDTAEAIADWEKDVDLSGELKRIERIRLPHRHPIRRKLPGAAPADLRPAHACSMSKASLTPKDKNAVAMVGSRMTTHYGIEAARKLAYQLAYLGVTVVSGGARGIDTRGPPGRA